MNGPSAAAMSWRSCANRSRRVSQAYNLKSVLNLRDIVDFAIRLMTTRGSGRRQ
jgi:hypothetical protein